MKYQLNESSQKRQKAILDTLKTGVPLAGLLAVTTIFGGGCGNAEPIVGIIAPPASAESSPTQVQQSNRVNENQAPVKQGDISIVGDIVSPSVAPVAPEKHDK